MTTPPAWADQRDHQFLDIVTQHRKLGYGRMMHLISELWQQSDPKGALTVGDTYSGQDKKRKRCRLEGHDWSPGGDYDWCDRCEAKRPKVTE